MIWLSESPLQSPILQILSLYAFVLSVCHQKYATTPVQAKKSKKKEGVQKTASENLSQRIIGLMRHLKQELQICDNELGECGNSSFLMGWLY